MTKISVDIKPVVRNACEFLTYKGMDNQDERLVRLLVSYVLIPNFSEELEVNDYLLLTQFSNDILYKDTINERRVCIKQLIYRYFRDYYDVDVDLYKGKLLLIGG